MHIGHNFRVWAGVVLASGALCLTGCGDSDSPDEPGSTSPATEAPQSAQPAGGANPFLDRVGAQTAYLYANLERLPEDLADRFWSLSDMSAEVNQQTLGEIAEDDEISPAMAVLLNKMASLTTRAGWEEAGFHGNPFYAVHAVSVLPFAHLELADADAFKAWLAEIEAELDAPLDRRDLDGVEVIWIEIEEGFGLALSQQGNALSLALVPDDAEWLTRLTGQAPTVDAYGARQLVEFNRDNGYIGAGSGFVDWQRMVAELLDGESFISRMLDENAEEVRAVRENPACIAEYNAVVQAMPRLTFGYTRLDAEQMELAARQEMAPDLAQSLMPVARAPVALDRPLTGQLNLGFAFDLLEARRFATGLVEGWIANPPACPSFADIAADAPEWRKALARPIPPMVSNVHGFFLEADQLKFDDGMPTGGGTLSVFMNNPQVLVGMAQMFSPAVAEVQLEPGGAPQRVPEGAIPQLDQTGLEGWLAMAENAIGLAIGEQHAETLPSALTQTEPDAFLLAGRLDFEIFLQLVDLAESVVDDLEQAVDEQSAAEAAKAIELQRAQYQAMIELYDQGRFGWALTERGIEFTGGVRLQQE